MIAFITSLDMWVLQTLYALRDVPTTHVMIWISQLGEWYVVLGLAVALALWLALKERFIYAQGLLLTVVSTTVVTFVLKSLIGRARPPEQFWAYLESGASFPSAHATLSLAFYGFLIYLLYRTMRAHYWNGTLIALLNLLIIAIGCTRLYLGVHYFSDVVGGYLVGALCLWLGIEMTRLLQRR